MKRHVSIICAFLLLPGLLTACTTDPSSETQIISSSLTASQPEEYTPLAPPEALLENLLLQLNDLIDNDYTRELVHCFDTADLSIFVLGRIGGGSWVVVQEKATLDLYPFEISFSGANEIQQAEEANCVTIFLTDPYIFGGDKMLNHPSGTITVRYTDGEVVNTSLWSLGSGKIGLQRGLDYLLFGECTVEDETISFTFEADFEKEGVWNNEQEQGTEIYLHWDAFSGQGEYHKYVVLFNETALTLPQSFTQQILGIEAVHSAEFSYLETEFFTGTQLTLYIDWDCNAHFYLNKDGGLYEFMDFTIEIVK